MRRAPKLPICENYETYLGNPVAVLFRKDNTSQTEPCPFCAQRHKHGYPDGHRNDHCGDNVTFKRTRWGYQEVKLTPDEIIASDGTILKRANGYIIRTRSDTNNETPKRRINQPGPSGSRRLRQKGKSRPANTALGGLSKPKRPTSRVSHRTTD